MSFFTGSTCPPKQFIVFCWILIKLKKKSVLDTWREDISLFWTLKYVFVYALKHIKFWTMYQASKTCDIFPPFFSVPKHRFNKFLQKLGLMKYICMFEVGARSIYYANINSHLDKAHCIIHTLYNTHTQRIEILIICFD